jgi:hypothetical protein
MTTTTTATATNAISEPEPIPEEVTPFSRQELRGMLRAPLRMADLVLGARHRFSANIAQEHRYSEGSGPY